MDNKTLAKAETAQNDFSSMITLHTSVTETIPPQLPYT